MDQKLNVVPTEQTLELGGGAVLHRTLQYDTCILVVNEE